MARPDGLLVGAVSRVAPEYVFVQAPGRLFIIPVAGNFVDEEGLASMGTPSSISAYRLSSCLVTPAAGPSPRP
jgi:hypothetical protein